jgi:ABC-2 type transport system permease protein
MNNLVRSELRKLATTLWFKITVVTTLVLGPVAAAINALTSKEPPAVLGSAISIHHVLSIAPLTSMVMMAVGISIVGSEYRHGTSIPTFLITPRRRDVVIAKLITATALGAVIGAITFGLSVAAAVPSLSSKGVHHLAGDTAQMWIGCAGATALYGALGIAVGAVTRSTVVAIIGTLAWVFFFEGAFLDNLFPSIGKWLPTGANMAVTHTADHLSRLLSPVQAAIVLVAWTLALTTTGLRASIRRDV